MAKPSAASFAAVRRVRLNPMKILRFGRPAPAEARIPLAFRWCGFHPWHESRAVDRPVQENDTVFRPVIQTQARTTSPPWRVTMLVTQAQEEKTGQVCSCPDAHIREAIASALAEALVKDYREQNKPQ